MEKEGCVFCKIIRGEIDCLKIYEDKDVFAFLDVNPYSRGHMLVIPRKHSRWVWDMDLANYEKLMEKVYYLANVLRRAFSTEWVEEVVAGMGVEHTHIHLLPRVEGDGLAEIPIKPLEPKLSKEEMEEIAERIKSFL